MAERVNLNVPLVESERLRAGSPPSCPEVSGWNLVAWQQFNDTGVQMAVFEAIGHVPAFVWMVNSPWGHLHWSTAETAMGAEEAAIAQWTKEQQEWTKAMEYSAEFLKYDRQRITAEAEMRRVRRDADEKLKALADQVAAANRAIKEKPWLSH